MRLRIWTSYLHHHYFALTRGFPYLRVRFLGGPEDEPEPGTLREVAVQCKDSVPCCSSRVMSVYLTSESQGAPCVLDPHPALRPTNPAPPHCQLTA